MACRTEASGCEIEMPVCRPCGLTEEEIAIVEGAVSGWETDNGMQEALVRLSGLAQAIRCQFFTLYRLRQGHSQQLKGG